VPASQVQHRVAWCICQCWVSGSVIAVVVLERSRPMVMRPSGWSRVQ
jgi:hypothetical protein